MTRRFLLAILVIGLIVPTVALGVDVDVNVYDDAVYLYLDKLAASRLIRSYSPNQRPLSREVVSRLITEAAERCGENCAPGDQRLITELTDQFSRRKFMPISEARLSWTTTTQPESAVPTNGLSQTGGTVQPLLSYKNGQHYIDTANFYLDTSHYIRATPYFAAYVQPQFYVVSGSNAYSWLWLWRAYVKTGIKDFELQVGRDDVKWGPGEESLMFSTNFKGLDMIRLTSPATFRFPWVFKHLGQWRFTTFFGLLGKGFSNPYTVLSAYRVDWHPIDYLNFGFDHAVMMGGRGADDPTPLEAINEYIGFTSSSGNWNASSNHVMGADMVARIPPLLGVELYAKVLLEDTQKEYYYMLVNNASWMGGLYFPKLEASRRWSLRTEFVYTGQFAYRHGFYTSGWSLDGKFMGYDAGSDTYSVTTTLRHQFNLREFVAGSFRYLYRSSNTYATSLDASGDPNGLTTLSIGPKEQHYILKATGTKRLTKYLDVYADIGLDRTLNKGFVQGSNAVDFSTQVMFTLHDLVKP